MKWLDWNTIFGHAFKPIMVSEPDSVTKVLYYKQDPYIDINKQIYIYMYICVYIYVTQTTATGAYWTAEAPLRGEVLGQTRVS